MVLETVGLLAVAGLLLWGALRWIAVRPRLLTNVKACRGQWAEARIRRCERGIEVTGIPVEPFNAFSNLSYLAAGWLLSRYVPGPASLIVAATMTLLCVGSTMYHGTKTMWGARLDHAGMYATFGALAIYCLAPEHLVIPYVMAGGALVLAIGFAFVAPGDLNTRMGLLLALMAIRAFLLGTPRLAGLSLGLFTVAFVAWILDQRTTVLSRFGHAIWHVLTALAMTTMFAALTA